MSNVADTTNLSTTNGAVARVSLMRSLESVELRTLSQLVQNVSSPHTMPRLRSTARMERVRFLHDMHGRFTVSNTALCTITVKRFSPASS